MFTIVHNRENQRWQVCVEALHHYLNDEERIQAVVHKVPGKYWLILAEFSSKRRAAKYIHYLNGGSTNDVVDYEFDD